MSLKEERNKRVVETHNWESQNVNKGAQIDGGLMEDGGEVHGGPEQTRVHHGEGPGLDGGMWWPWTDG